MNLENNQSSNRLLALDVFRGITIAGMVLVNNSGNWSAVYAPLEHAKWNGWTPTDLIFPFFCSLSASQFRSRSVAAPNKTLKKRQFIRRYVAAPRLFSHLVIWNKVCQVVFTYFLNRGSDSNGTETYYLH